MDNHVSETVLFMTFAAFQTLNLTSWLPTLVLSWMKEYSHESFSQPIQHAASRWCGRKCSNLTVNTLGGQLQSTIYKIAYHGAGRLANSVTWLTPIKPYSAFASSECNFGNCRHPRCEAIRHIENLRTIEPAQDHAFYCGNSASQNPTDYPRYDLQK